MARPKTFERDKALANAKMVFWKQGYSATTTDDLRLAMGIGRQSFYDTFKSKHDIFVEVLKMYNSDRGVKLATLARKSDSPLKILESILMQVADEDAELRSLGCIGISSVCEFGTADEMVADANHRAGLEWKKTFERLLSEAHAVGELRSSVDVKATALFLQSILAGLRLSARGGVKPKELREIAKVAIDGLKK